MILNSPHTHIQTPFTGSTVDAFIKKAIDLGRTHFSYTDYGHMGEFLSTYKLCKDKKLKFVGGIEVFFNDAEDPTLSKTKARKSKYYKTTLYAPTQHAFETLSKLSSKSNRTKTKFNGDQIGLWDFKDLEIAAEAGCVLVGSDVNDLIGKHILFDDVDSAESVASKLKSLFNDNMYIAIIGVSQDRYFDSFIKVALENKKELLLKPRDRVSTNVAKSVSARELQENSQRHFILANTYKNGIMERHNQRVVSTKTVRGFIKLTQGDIQKKVNLGLINIAKKLNINLLYSDYSFYADESDKIVQDVRLSSEDRREYAKRHMHSAVDALRYLLMILGLNKDEALELLKGNEKFCALFDSFDLKYEYRLPEVESDSLMMTMNIIREEGRMKWDSPVYVDRLKKEIGVLAKNDKVNLLPYFFPIRDVLKHYKQNNQLVGPARGSAAGCLLMYLMGITEVDPIKHGLSFERFLSLDRILAGNLPDVDVDLKNRELLVGEDGRSGYLYNRWGKKAAQISTKSLLRLKSSILDVNRYFNGEVSEEIKKISKSLPAAPQGVSDTNFVFGYEMDGIHYPGLIEINDDLKKYIGQYPKEWEVVQKCLGLVRQTSKHASAFLIADTAIENIVPMVSEENNTQYDAKSAEAAKLIKYDFLVVSQLEDIDLAIKLINEKNGHSSEYGIFEHNGKKHYIWDLPEDQAVFRSVWSGDTETIFQLHTNAMSPFVKKILPKNIDDISTILALVRPGPLDFIDENTGRNMAEEYIERRFSRSSANIKIMEDLLPETYGIQVYQEQTTKVALEIGKMDPIDAENLRRHFSKKDKEKAMGMKPLFMKGAIETVGLETAETIWSQMETSSRYSFNKSHSVSYAYITYACMFLKHYYPLEWWTAVLSNATEEEVSKKLFRFVRDKLSPPDINISDDNRMKIDYANNTIRAKLTILKGLGEKTAASLISKRPYASLADFIEKDVCSHGLAEKLIHVGVLDSLFETGLSLNQKMQLYWDAVALVEYNQKIKEGKKATLSKKPINTKYLGLHPIKDFSMKKAILPTLPLNLSSLISKYSTKLFNEGGRSIPFFSDSRGSPVKFLNGEQTVRLEEIDNESELSFCFAGYILDLEERAYAKNTKKMLKITIDCDGYIFDRVMWPDYNTGKLIYPNDLEKGSVAILFCKKRPKKESSISDIIVEKSS
jgi:DNA-directed DNA polymerase III PolC